MSTGVASSFATKATRTVRETGLHSSGVGGLRTLADRRSEDPQAVNRLIDDTLRDPYEGIGKPEPLKHALAGAWSRRITDEHRLVYLPRDGEVVVLQARYHYE